MNRRKWTLLIINLLLIAAVLTICVCYQTMGYSHTLKWLGSGVAALVGFINTIYAFATRSGGKAFYIFNTLGLLMACIGDVLIDGQFVFGAATFAIGHIFFILSLCYVQPISLLDCIISSALFIGCLYLLVFAPFISFDSATIRVVFIIYGLIISVMLGKSIGNLIHAPSVATVILSLGGAVFFFSDLMLVLSGFSNIEGPLSSICLSTYYPALCLLAFGSWSRASSASL